MSFPISSPLLHPVKRDRSSCVLVDDEDPCSIKRVNAEHEEERTHGRTHSERGIPRSASVPLLVLVLVPLLVLLCSCALPTLLSTALRNLRLVGFASTKFWTACALSRACCFGCVCLLACWLAGWLAWSAVGVEPRFRSTHSAGLGSASASRRLKSCTSGVPRRGCVLGSWTRWNHGHATPQLC